jgi:putative tricarboxylic transport membrane protein
MLRSTILHAATALSVVSLSLMLPGDASAQAAWKPERNVELVVSAGPGGNQDITARVMHSIWQERRIVTPSTVVNKPGGGGAIASHYVDQHAGNPHYLLMLAPTLFTSRIMGTTKHRHTDFTPLAMLFNEYIFVTVRSESPLKSGKDMIAKLKAAPDSLSVAIATAIGNHIHMGVALPMKAAGVEIRKMKIVPFKSSGQSITALLGGHIDVAASTFGTVLPHLEAGRVRIIGVSSPQRLTGQLATIPTWTEQGAKSDFSSWRGIAAPRNISESHVKYWEGAIAATTQTEEWKKDVERNHRSAHYMGSRETRKYWDAQYVELEEALTELGLAKPSN